MKSALVSMSSSSLLGLWERMTDILNRAHKIEIFIILSTIFNICSLTIWTMSKCLHVYMFLIHIVNWSVLLCHENLGERPTWMWPECKGTLIPRGVVHGNWSWWPRLMKLRWVLISAAAFINYLVNINIVIFGKFLIYFIPLASRFRWMSSHHKHSEKNRQRPQFII